MTDWAYRQLDSRDPAMRSSGCGPYAMVDALVRASDGGWRPDDRDATSAARARLRRSGASAAEFRVRGLTPSEVARSLARVGASRSRPALRSQLRRGVDVAGSLLPQLRRIGGCAVVAVDYGAIQRAGLAPDAAGRFSGGHWVTVDDPQGGAVRVADPLRTNLVRWPVDVLVEAMASFGRRPWGHGRGEAIVVWPWLTWRQAYEACREDAA